MPRPICVGRQPSWTRSAPGWPPSGSMPPASTPKCSGRQRARRRESPPRRGGSPHPPAGQPGNGPTIAFARSDLTIPWSSDYGTLLELAESCDVPVRWSCRTGVCQTCETTLIAGDVDYSPDPVEPPTEGSVFICCSHPRRHRARSVTAALCLMERAKMTPADTAAPEEPCPPPPHRRTRPVTHVKALDQHLLLISVSADSPPARPCTSRRPSDRTMMRRVYEIDSE